LARSFAFLFGSAVVARGAPFVANVALARSLSPAQFGVRSVHFELVSALVLTSRDAFRRACPRAAAGEAEAAARLAPPLGAACALVLALAARAALGGEPDGASYRTALYGYAAAAALELLAEPLHLAAARRGALRVRLLAEGACTWTRTGVAAALLLRPGSVWAVELRFAAAQLAGSAALLAAHALGASSLCGGPGWARRARPPPPSLPLRRLLAEFTVQAYWKVLLAEGDKLALLFAAAAQRARVFAPRGADAAAAAAASAASAEAQGVYGLAAGLGGLVARLLLQPFEEAAFGSFASAAAGGRRCDAQLRSLLRPLLLLALLAAAAGPPCAGAVLRLLYGPAWARARGGAATLAAFALYIPLLALNGLLEAYAAAGMSARQLRSGNGVLLAAALASAAVAAAAAPRLGAPALVLGNAAGMALRIGAAARFAAAGGGGGAMLRGAMPRGRTLAALAALAALLFASQRRMAEAGGTDSWAAAAAHLGRSGGAVLCLLPLAAAWERAGLRAARAALAR